MTDFAPVIATGEQDPYATYEKLRRRGPVTFLKDQQTWVVTGYEEVAACLRNHGAFSSAIGAMGTGIGQSMIFTDPPEHSRLRGVVSKAFTPRSIAALEPRIAAIADDILAKLEGGVPFDIVSELAIPLPITVIAEMIGVDPADRADFKRWSDAIVGRSFVDPDDLAAEFGAYFGRVLEERRREPSYDLISRLAMANDRDALTAQELMDAVMLLLVAGNETTTNLISLATLQFARYPEQRARVLADPSLLPNAIEEILRFDGPVHMIPPRMVLRDTQLGDVTVDAGKFVIPYIAAADRDPRRFERPDAFDVTRPDASANIAFGAGIHFCLGAPLARLEGRIVVDALLERAPEYRLAHPDEPVSFQANPFLRSMDRLEIVA